MRPEDRNQADEVRETVQDRAVHQHDPEYQQLGRAWPGRKPTERPDQKHHGDDPQEDHPEAAEAVTESVASIRLGAIGVDADTGREFRPGRAH